VSTFDGRCSVPSSVLLGFEGTGQMSHLGRVTTTGSQCTQIDQTDVNRGTFTDGRFTWTAANGDTLTTTHSGSYAIRGGVSYIQGEEIVTGGTGRFAGASGTLDFTAEQVFPDGLLYLTYAGSITYDASQRARR
jgi:hypothetical protein